MKLRNYQTRAIEKLRRAVRRGHKSVILCAPCGAGKTVIASEMLQRAVELGNRAAFIVDAIELVNQTSEKLESFGLDAYSMDGHGIIKAGEEFMPQAPVQVISVQTWWSWIKRKKIKMPKFDFLIFDECQSSMAKTRRAILHSSPIRIGLTATPAQSNGKALGSPWEKIVVAATYSELISNGSLVPIRCRVPQIVDTSGWTVNYESGEFVIGPDEIESIDRQITGNLMDSIRDYCGDRRFLVFCADVKHSIKMAEMLTENGIPTAHVDAKTPKEDRLAASEGIRSGQLRGLTNYNIFGRGVDLPEISAVLNCRPFNSIVAYRQAMARGGRPCEGKEDCLVIDHTGAVLRHGYPDDDIEWPAPKSADDVRTLLHEKKSNIIQRVCPKCSEYWENGKPECPACGYRPQKRGRLVPTMPGSLTEISRKAARRQRNASSGRRLWGRCLGVAANKGMTVRQARSMYQSIAGNYPLKLDRTAPEDWDTKVSVLYPGFLRRKKT